MKRSQSALCAILIAVGGAVASSAWVLNSPRAIAAAPQGNQPSSLAPDSTVTRADILDTLSSCQWRYHNQACDCDISDCGDRPNDCGTTVACESSERVLTGGCRLSGDSSVSLRSSFAFDQGDVLTHVNDSWYWNQNLTTGWACDFEDVALDDGNIFTPPTIHVAASALCCGD